MATAAQMVAMAASQIGVKESPSGSNRVKYWDWYGSPGQGNPWCDCFVSWCADQIGAGNIVGKYAYCPSHVNYFKKIGRWLDRSEKPQPGDIVFFSNGTRACHVGIVEKRNGTESVTTIEGNTSVTSNDNGGSVMRRVRKYGSVGSSWFILGFGRPDYSGASGTVTSGSTSNPSGSQGSSSSAGTNEKKQFQQWLNDNYGSYIKREIGALLDVDGLWGPKTKKAATIALQVELNKQYGKGLDVDGIWGEKTEAACVVVREGAKGNITRVLQGCLIFKGYSTNGFDGDFGSGTENAVKSFQASVGITKDGEAGPITFSKLLG